MIPSTPHPYHSHPRRRSWWISGNGVELNGEIVPSRGVFPGELHGVPALPSLADGSMFHSTFTYTDPWSALRYRTLRRDSGGSGKVLAPRGASVQTGDTGLGWFIRSRIEAFRKAGLDERRLWWGRNLEADRGQIEGYNSSPSLYSYPAASAYLIKSRTLTRTFCSFGFCFLIFPVFIYSDFVPLRSMQYVFNPFNNASSGVSIVYSTTNS